MSIVLKVAQVALKTFVDNITVQVVENLLINDLWELFSPVDVGSMPSETVAKIAEETSESQALRQQLTRKLAILEKGLEVCQRYSSPRTLLAPPGKDERPKTRRGRSKHGKPESKEPSGSLVAPGTVSSTVCLLILLFASV